VFEEMLRARNDVAATVCELANLPIRGKPDLAQLAKCRDAVATLYYKFFDFLPAPVLDSLILLEVCLEHPQGGPYCLTDRRVLPIQKCDLASFIDNCTSIENGKYSAAIILTSNNPDATKLEVIRLHARHVLFTLNRLASLQTYMTVVENLQKGRVELGPSKRRIGSGSLSKS
jgi:hypothetical protein